MNESFEHWYQVHVVGTFAYPLRKAIVSKGSSKASVVVHCYPGLSSPRQTYLQVVLLFLLPLS